MIRDHKITIYRMLIFTINTIQELPKKPLISPYRWRKQLQWSYFRRIQVIHKWIEKLLFYYV
jgi:hypothetical protein